MFTVALKGMKARAPIGLYAEERITENDIELDIALSRPAALSALPFFNYEDVYQIAQAALQEPAALLEDVLIRIAKKLEEQFPDTWIDVAITKRHPPLGGEVERSYIRWTNKSSA